MPMYAYMFPVPSSNLKTCLKWLQRDRMLAAEKRPISVAEMAQNVDHFVTSVTFVSCPIFGQKQSQIAHFWPKVGHNWLKKVAQAAIKSPNLVTLRWRERDRSEGQPCSEKQTSIGWRPSMRFEWAADWKRYNKLFLLLKSAQQNTLRHTAEANKDLL